MPRDHARPLLKEPLKVAFRRSLRQQLLVVVTTALKILFKWDVRWPLLKGGSVALLHNVHLRRQRLLAGQHYRANSNLRTKVLDLYNLVAVPTVVAIGSPTRSCCAGPGTSLGPAGGCRRRGTWALATARWRGPWTTRCSRGSCGRTAGGAPGRVHRGCGDDKGTRRESGAEARSGRIAAPAHGDDEVAAALRPSVAQAPSWLCSG